MTTEKQKGATGRGEERQNENGREEEDA